MSVQDDFTPKEWLTLQFTPLWIFLAVAGADGVLDRKELKIFLRELRRGVFRRDLLVREVFWNLGKQLDRILGHFTDDPRPVDEGLRDAARILAEKGEPEQRAAFAGALELLGRKIADASAPGFLRFGDRTSPEERAAIEGIRSAFAPSDRGDGPDAG